MPRNLSSTVDQTIDLGSRVLVLLTDAVGEEQANAILDSRRKGARAIRMPDGIFESYCQHVWHVRYTQQRRKALGRAFAAIAETRLRALLSWLCAEAKVARIGE